MRQASLKLKMYAQNVRIVDNNNLQRRVLTIILSTFGALALFYVLILGNMIFNIIERRTLEADTRVLLAEVGDLELSYLSLSSKIDPTLGRSLGFTETKIKQFATRKSLGSLKVAQNEL
ncbi:MAG: hypothetical protein AAB943_00415 [Patescibacteria group bacterium]